MIYARQNKILRQWAGLIDGFLTPSWGPNSPGEPPYIYISLQILLVLGQVLVRRRMTQHVLSRELYFERTQLGVFTRLSFLLKQKNVNHA